MLALRTRPDCAGRRWNRDCEIPSSTSLRLQTLFCSLYCPDPDTLTSRFSCCCSSLTLLAATRPRTHATRSTPRIWTPASGTRKYTVDYDYGIEHAHARWQTSAARRHEQHSVTHQPCAGQTPAAAEPRIVVGSVAVLVGRQRADAHGESTLR